jgi:AbrB family looped-hinge helix DNA binding protein
MKTTIDTAGRLVIPKEIREQAGITPGMPLNIRVDNGVIEIEPEYLPVRLEERDGLLVAVPLKDVPPLPVDIVEQMREQIDDERSGMA